MKKGISIWSFAEPDIKKCFELAKDAGFDGVELALDAGGAITMETTKEKVMAIKKMAQEVGIELYSVASGLYWTYNYTSGDEAKRNRAKEITRKQLEVASWLGCDTILVVPGAVNVAFEQGGEVVEYDVAYERALSALRELAPYAEQLKVSIGVENVWNKFLLSPVEMAEFIDKVGSDYVGSYFDVGNVLYIGYPEHWIKVLGNRIKKVHFKDYRREAGSLCGFVDLLSGDVDYPAVMTAFGKIGYDGWATAEMIPPYANYPETIIYNTSNAMDKILGRK
ncbi:MAG: sugar phosphate isomerase/epimerase [Oscillospiraceae bacterium]|nr:sugar phosphate isomerase/epimerase [Oscillospiraceae bacterium]